jgi:hypothetical protein
VKDEWLSETYGYQSTHFKVDYRRMQTDIDYRISYLQTNLTAAMVEIGEAFNEVPWKPWTASTSLERQSLYEAGRHRFVGEMVDVLFFIANALTAANVTDSELQWAYSSKKRVNEERQASGTYDGMTKEKCGADGCTRALDEPGINVVVNAVGQYCSVECAMKMSNEPMYVKKRTVSNEERIRK